MVRLRGARREKGEEIRDADRLAFDPYDRRVGGRRARRDAGFRVIRQRRDAEIEMHLLGERIAARRR